VAACSPEAATKIINAVLGHYPIVPALYDLSVDDSSNRDARDENMLTARRDAELTALVSHRR